MLILGRKQGEDVEKAAPLLGRIQGKVGTEVVLLKEKPRVRRRERNLS